MVSAAENTRGVEVDDLAEVAAEDEEVAEGGGHCFAGCRALTENLLEDRKNAAAEKNRSEAPMAD